MTDELKLRRQQDRGQRAQLLIENELFKEAIENIEQTILDAWKGSASTEEKQRHNAYLMYRLLQNFKQQFTTAISTGKVAQKELLRIKEESKIRRIINGR